MGFRDVGTLGYRGSSFSTFQFFPVFSSIFRPIIKTMQSLSPKLTFLHLNTSGMVSTPDDTIQFFSFTRCTACGTEHITNPFLTLSTLSEF